MYDDDYREIYITGARGGIQSAYHLKIDFYVERLRLPLTKEKLEIFPDGTQKRMAIDVGQTKTVEREFKVGIMMSFYAAKELFRWLGQRISEIEQIEKKIQETPPASKEATEKSAEVD